MSKLHVDSVRKTYSGKAILSDVFLSCNIGEIKGLLGRNGSGKSTLLKIIFGVEKSDDKFIRAANKVVKNVSDSKNLIQYLPQENFLPNKVKIKSLIQLFLGKENSNEVLTNEYIKPLLNKFNQDLSGGEKRIIEILLILHSNTKFILLDEPFNGLSPVLKNYIIEYIQKSKLQKGIIITDHDYTNVIQLADKILYLRDGVLKEISSQNDLVKLGYLSMQAYEDLTEKL